MLVKNYALWISAILMFLYWSTADAKPVENSGSWTVSEMRDDFDDSLVSLSVLVLDSKQEGGWIGASCNISKKEFVFSISSGKYGGRLSDVDKQKNNFRYRIDREVPVITTLTQHVAGSATTTNIKSEIVEDIMRGGSMLVTQHLSESGNNAASKFQLLGAAKALRQLVKKCT